MKIGIIGSGEVAQSLGNGLVQAGHTVMLGTRDTNKKGLGSWRKKNDKKRLLGSTTEAAAYGEMVVLAVVWHAAEDILAQVRPELAGKVVIDVTNPLVFNEGEPPARVCTDACRPPRAAELLRAAARDYRGSRTRGHSSKSRGRRP